MDKKILLILMMGGSNALMKLLPVRLLSARSLPPFFVTWLKYVPVPVLAAMLASDLLMKDGRCHFSFSNLYLLAAAPTFLVAGFSKNLFLTVLVGMVCLAGLRLWI